MDCRQIEIEKGCFLHGKAAFSFGENDAFFPLLGTCRPISCAIVQAKYCLFV